MKDQWVNWEDERKAIVPSPAEHLIHAAVLEVVSGGDSCCFVNSRRGECPLKGERKSDKLSSLLISC